ncbi:MAG: ferrous iron transport protein A [Candidatus Afipia apatlaquensis]|uniref:Ferrous iron transport protein A n=1 Tax=Candidatus Afipia apatlaquensis TaxID=2712852 RepID=A0A7C9VQF3_9BRAD|nr:ferrous iron transport protein A [Candidatus Afipia apatlaquensis]
MTDDVTEENQHTSLGVAQRGFRGLIGAIVVDADHDGVPAIEIERRLLELGFVEGAVVEVLHEGPLGRDPIAVRVNNTTIALRRREAMAILVT